MTKVLVGIEDDFSELLERFNRAGLEYEQKTIEYDYKELIHNLYKYDFIIASGGRWSSDIFKELKSLKLLVKFGVGVDNIDIEAAQKYGISIANAPGSNSFAVAEHAIMLILALMRKVIFFDKKVKNGDFHTSKTDSIIGKKIGIIGFRNIGTKLAELLRGFPVEVSAYDESFDENVANKLNVSRKSIDEIIQSSDIISLHIPATDKTRYLVNKEFFANMKNGSYLINTSRASVVNEKDLINALKSGILKGAALDTFDTNEYENLREYAGMDNVLLTPHNASITDEAFNSIMNICIDNIIEFYTTGNCRNIVRRG